MFSFRCLHWPFIFALLTLTSACSMDNPEETLQLGQNYLAENAKKPGVKTTASGLQYEILREGSGPLPTPKDSVTVNYKGALISGDTFDAGKNITFPLANVIPGWVEGLQLMKEGASYRFVIPPDLAYGEAGAGRAIPGNATLVFDVDLVKVNR